MRKLIALMLLAITVSGCRNVGAKLGGNITLELPAGERLVEITWKNTQLWYLTRPRTENEKPTTYKFRERSDTGIMEGTVTVIEH